MKFQHYLLAMAVGVCCCSCGSTENKTLGIGIKQENRDETIRPGDDFYEYATGGWMKLNPLTPEYSRYGSMDKLAELNNQQLRGLVEELSTTQHEKGSVAQKLADMYKLVTDSVRLNQEGAEPLKGDMEAVDALADKAQLFQFFAKNSMYLSAFFNYGFEADMKSSKENLFQFAQGGLSLGQKDYYLDTDEATLKIRNQFQDHIVTMFKMYGDNEEQAKTRMQDVMRIETRLAKASLSNVEMRDPERMYHKVSTEVFKKTYSQVDWDAFFKSIGVEVAAVNDGTPDQMKEVVAVISSESLDALKNYLKWNILTTGANMISDDYQQADFDFFGKAMSGKQEMQPRWKRAINTVNGTLGMALGQIYTEKYFPAAAKERMVQLVKNLQTALGQRIDAQEWMSAETKQKAHEKLSTFIIKVGYPDTWKDYSSLTIDPAKSYYENMKAVTAWNWEDQKARCMNKPVDPTEWFMTPQTVNAYYNPTTNEICFPAGILQYPFFDMTADDAFNYGAIGVVIGHEMTHGFDDQGSQFDKDGNLSVWWTEEDRTKFTALTDKMAAFFDKIEVLPGLFANGKFTNGENIADHGGLEISFQAFKNATKDAPLPTVDGLTPEQRFFISYAGVWGQNIREEEIRRRTKMDPHSLGRWRVNGALPHIDAWYEAFGVKEGDKMYIPTEQRVYVW